MAIAEAAEPPPYITSSTDPDVPPPAAQHHEEYYFEDGNLVVLVSGILFRLWDGALRRHSTAFPVPAPSLDDKIADGADDAHPLVLDGVDPADFERLLWIIYPPRRPPRDWTAVLALATRWKFTAIRELALRELSGLAMDAVERIELAQRFRVRRAWAWGAYVEVCGRAHALDVIEGRQLGIETTVKVAFAREKLDKWGRKKPDEVKKVVAEVFEITEEGA